MIRVGSSVQLTLRDAKVVRGTVTQVLATDLKVGDHWYALRDVQELKYGVNEDYDDAGRVVLGVLFVGAVFMAWVAWSLNHDGIE